MPSTGDEKPRLRENLIRQGVAPEEIRRIYQSLRDRGYGEEEARAAAAAGQEKPDRPASSPAPTPPDRRRGAPTAEPARERRAPAVPGAEMAPSGAAPREAPQKNRRASDWIPAIPLRLRRQINRYAFRGSFLITGFVERFDDFLCVFDPRRPDCAGRAFLRLMADRKGWRGRNPYRLSFIDCLDALRESARRLLGLGPDPDDPSEAEEDAAKLRVLQMRDPFVVEFLSLFARQSSMLRVGLDYLGASLEEGRRVPISELARVAKDGCRLIETTAPIERDRLDTVIDFAREADAARAPDGKPQADFVDAEAVFRAVFQSLALYHHELYPVLLKMIGAFYREEDRDPGKREKIMAFLDMRDDDILTWEGWHRRQRERRESEQREREARELARLESEKAASISGRFEGTLSTLASLFPESGIERIEQGHSVLPYFVNRVFGRSALFQARQRDLEQLASTDVMGVVLVIHTLLDDMLVSVDPFALEKIVGREGYASNLSAIRDDWQEAYPRLFEPYLDTVADYAREVGGDLRAAQLFREGTRSRALEERVNQLRNKAIRTFGHLMTSREQFDAPRVFEMAARLAVLLTEAGDMVNQGMLTAEDPVAHRTRDELAETKIVDLEAVTLPGSIDYRPVARQIRRWIEARFREPVGEIPQKAQVAFMDVFRGLAYLYESLLNDPRSFASRSSHAVVTASLEDRAAWTRERTERGRDSLQSLQATLREQFPGQFVDALTGLRNKDYFLTELPRALAKVRARGAPVTFLMIDIDHFKWVNDRLGHPRGDDVLKATAAMILDGIREGDLAVRYGGEEILIAVPSDLHRGIVLAERLRYAQENKLLLREAMADVRGLSLLGSEPCGTLSIGVADVTGIADDLTKAVEKVDRALYAAKKGRNAVVYIDPLKEKLGPEPFLTYGDYRRKAGGFTT